jgi:nicotinamide-nucleotide amidase
MAEGVRRVLGSDLSIAITGIAGPDGGSDEKPVGLTYIALADGEMTEYRRFLFGRHRETNKRRASQAALEMVRRRLLNRER